MNIMLLKLTTGETVIAEWTGTVDNSYSLRNVRLVDAQKIWDGGDLEEWFPFSRLTELPMDRSRVVMAVANEEIDPVLVEQYIGYGWDEGAEPWNE